MDVEISKQMLQILKKQGLDFSLSTKVTGGNVTASGVTVNVESVKGEKLPNIQADYVLVSTGRRPYTNNLGLANVGIETDK